MTQVVGVIVAAGESSRMGDVKQLLPLGERPMLQWVVDAAEASRLDQVVVVTGSAARSVQAKVKLGRAFWAHNPRPELGTMSSLRAGVAAAGPVDAVVKLVGDQPEIATAVIDELIDSWDPLTHSASLVQYRDGEGHPMLFEAGALQEIIEEDGDRLLWRLVQECPARVNRLPIDRLRPIDVNQPSDFLAVAARLGHDPPPMTRHN